MEIEVRKKSLLRSEIGFGLLHLAPLLMIWTGSTAFDWMVCLFLYFIRMFFVTGGYHRYFAHKTYKTSRFVQFLIAFGAETSLQKGALWWAAHHRSHHKYSDTPKDPHSNKLYGFWYSHIGWIMGPDYKETDFDQIRDYAKFKDIRWINKHYLIPPLVLLAAVWLIGGYVNSGGDWSQIFTAGLSTVVVGFFTSTVILFHGTFSINSLMHIIGTQRYESKDESKNSLILALVTLGEGWHNNHHYYQSSVRQGFFWWEIDITFYMLKILSWFGIIWDLRPVPLHIKNSKTKEEARELAMAGKR